MPVYTAPWGRCTGLDGGPQLCHPSLSAQRVLYYERRRKKKRGRKWGGHYGVCPFAPLFSLDLWQILCDPPRFEGELEFGSPWVAGSAEAAAAAAVVPPASSADIAGNAAAGTLETGPSVLVTMLGCKGRDFPYHTWVAGSPLGEPRGSVGCNTGKSQA